MNNVLLLTNAAFLTNADIMVTTLPLHKQLFTWLSIISINILWSSSTVQAQCTLSTICTVATLQLQICIL